MLDYQLPIIEGYLERDYQTTNQMLTALFNRVTFNMGSTSLTYWKNKFSKEKQANRMMLKLVQDGVIKTEIRHNYATLELNHKWLLTKYTQDRLNTIITNARINRYLPLLASEKKPLKATSVSLTSGVTESGLVRYGFAEAGHHEFKYDVTTMAKYRDEIVKFSIKSMEKMEAKLNKSLRIPAGYDYQSLIESIIDMIIDSKDEEYILGELILDSRGRAIYETLKTVFNPISNKIARAVVIAPAETVTPVSLDNAYLFIAELYHGFTADIPNKIQLGQQCYRANSLLDLDTSTEDGLDDLFENIWLERLYADIKAWEADNNHQVTTPLEVDFSSSNLVIMGLLLNHNEYIDSTKYMWSVEGLTKQHVKFAQTPYVFGSSASIKSLWTKNRLKFTPKQIKLMKYEQAKGKFAIANEFKDIIIHHCNPSSKMRLLVDREEFTVECNKTKNIGETTQQHIVIDSVSQSFKLIHHTNTHKVPDLKQFKRYFVTGLIHNADSQVLDNICLKMKWILPIHDAGIVSWTNASDMRNQAVVEMAHLYKNGRDIVYNYLISIGIDTKGLARYAKLLETIDTLGKGKKPTISPYLLK